MASQHAGMGGDIGSPLEWMKEEVHPASLLVSQLVSRISLDVHTVGMVSW